MSETNAEKIGAVINEPTAPTYVFNKFDGGHPPQATIVFNLPNLKVDVYDRVDETAEVLRALCEDEEQFHLVVAPSGFGKTYLLTKILQEVTDGAVIKPAYEKTVQRIAVFDCRETKTLSKVVGDFANLIGGKLEYAPHADEKPKEWLNKKLFAALRRAGTVWLVLENFETWLDAEKGFTIREPDMRVFLSALFEGNHSLRVLCFSQAEPAPDIKKRFKQPPNVGEELYEGLPEAHALKYLQTEGADVGLDRADEELLTEFLRRVGYIPQALSSLIGYLETIEDYGFAELMADTELWAGFDDYEHERDEQDEGKRRTKALVAKQVLAQSEEVMLLLLALAFFGKPIPREALEILFDGKTQAARAISRLTAHRLATPTEDVRGTKYYELHAHFREQARKVLPPLENLDEASLENYAAWLAFVKGNEAHDKANFRLAVELRECAEKIYRLLIEQKGRGDLESDLATARMNKGNALTFTGRLAEAISEHDKAIPTYERLVEEGRGDLKRYLAGARMNKGVALDGAGRPAEAISEYDKAILTYERLVEEGRDDLESDLATARTNKGNALAITGRLAEAISEHGKAILTYERLVEEGRGDLENDLAGARTNKGSALDNAGRPAEAISEYDKAILTYERLVEEGRDDLERHLATVRTNKGVALNGAGRPAEAISEHDRAIMAYKRLVEEGRGDLENDLAGAHVNKGAGLWSAGRPAEAISEYDKAIAIRERLVEEGRGDLESDLAMAYVNKALALEDVPDRENALTCYERAVQLYMNCLNEFERIEILPNLMKVVSYRFNTLFKLERRNEAAQDAATAIRLLQDYSEHPELSEHFKAGIIKDFARIIRLISSRKPRENL